MGHSDSDTQFLLSIPNGILIEFRTEMFSGAYVRKNPAMFVDTAWVDVDELRRFLHLKAARSCLKLWCVTIKFAQQADERAEHVPNSSKSIKAERDVSPSLFIKKEPASDATTFKFEAAASSLFRTVTENGHEILELFSSDDEEDLVKPSLGLTQAEDRGMSSDTMVGDIMMDSDEDDEDDPHLFSHCIEEVSQANTSDMNSSASDSDDECGIHRDSNPTSWLEDFVSSTVEYGTTKITRQCSVSSVERLSEIPSSLPVPRDGKRAIVMDLSSPKFNVEDSGGELMTVDALFKDTQQDSWSGPTGNGLKDSRPMIETSVFGLDDGEEVRCRRTRLKCGGCSACEHVNPALLNHERYELDVKTLQDVVNIQIDSRLREADTSEKHALIFFAICHSSQCTAKNERGQTCSGVPTLVKFKNNVIKCGHHFFVSCNKWSRHFSEGHRASFIPSGVKDEHLQVLFSGGNLDGFEEPFPCGRIVPAHIGARVSHCNFPHSGNGSRAKLNHHSCPASLTGFIPDDTHYPGLSRMICIVLNEHPHNHPILPPTKTPVTIKEIYRDCVKKAGIVGSSVRTIDNARSTKLALGTSPSLYNPTLQNNRIKQDIIRDVKKKSYPCGTDLPGVIHCMNDDLSKPIEERYIHGFTVTDHDGRIIITANAFLLTRIHCAQTIFVDTTFKRTVGTLKEWEVVIFDKAVERALTIARVYTDRADRLQYKTIFDELQRVTFQLTGQHLRLKRLSKNGTLVSIGVDMELAQALGAGDSFLPTNKPTFSNINVQTAEEIIEYFVWSCYTHAKRGVHDLQTYVEDVDYNRLMNFMYLKTEEDVAEFSAWVKDLKNVKVQAWWDHKVNNCWILPSLVKCLSKMDPDDWDLSPPTTNVGESQHHWTNINTGVMLSLLEGILTARELDDKVAAEVKASLSTGVLRNQRNDTFTRTARSTARATHAYKKVQATRHRKKAFSDVDSQLTSLKDSQKENAAKIKELKAAKSKLTKEKSSKAESSSSGKSMVTGVSKRTRAEVASKKVGVKKDIDDRKRAASEVAVTLSTASESEAITQRPDTVAEPALFPAGLDQAVSASDNIFHLSENNMPTFDFTPESLFDYSGVVTGLSLQMPQEEISAPQYPFVPMSDIEPFTFSPARLSTDHILPLSDVTGTTNLFVQTPHPRPFIVNDVGSGLLPLFHNTYGTGFDDVDDIAMSSVDDITDFDSGLDSHTETIFNNFLARFG